MTKTIKKQDKSSKIVKKSQKEEVQPENMIKYRAIAMMFPKNHNDIIKNVVADWVPETQKGKVFIEHNYPNAYLPKRFSDFKMFDNKGEMINHCQNLIELVAAENQKQIKEESFETEETFFVTFKAGEQIHSTKCLSCPIYIMQEEDTTQIIVLSKDDLGIKPDKPKKIDFLYIDVTNDPTNAFSGGFVSLGYYNWRIELKDAVIINDDPITIVGMSIKFERKHNRPTRRAL